MRSSLLRLIMLACLYSCSTGLLSQPWIYDFGNSSLQATNSTNGNTTFFQGIPSGGGIYRVRVGQGGGSLSLDDPGTALGSGAEARLTASTGGATNKFSIHGWEAATATSYFKFSMRTSSAGSGTIAFALGASAAPGFSDNGSYTTAYNSSIAMLTFQFTNGNLAVTRRINGSNVAIGTSIVKDANHNIEVYANNSSASFTYARSGVSYTVNAGCWDLFVDGQRISNGTWPKAGTLAANSAIDAVCFFGESSPANAASIAMDDFDYSNALVVPCTPTVVVNASPSTTICTGTVPTFTASVVNGGTSPVYQWRKNGAVVGTNSNTYSGASLQSGDEINCTITSNSSCAVPLTAQSPNKVITVANYVTPRVEIISDRTGTICQGSVVTFTATSVNPGVSPVYQWKKNGVLVGSNSSSYQTNGLANNDVVTCTMISSEACPQPASVTSNGISFLVEQSDQPRVTIAASPSATVCQGKNVTFTATPVDAGNNYTISWKLNGVVVAIGSNTYSNNTLKTSDEIVCEVNANSACATPAIAISNKIVMTVNAVFSPKVTIAASRTVGKHGTQVEFVANPQNAGVSPIVEWRKNEMDTGAKQPSFATTIHQDKIEVYCVVKCVQSCATQTEAVSNKVVLRLLPDAPNQIILFDSLPDFKYKDSAYLLTAAATSGLPVAYSISHRNRVAISMSNRMYFRRPGKVTITAKQKGNSNYLPATPESWTFTVKKADQTILFDSLPDKTVGSPAFKLAAKSTSGGRVTFRSSDNTIAEVRPGGWLKIKKAGSVVIKAWQGGSTYYNSASATRVLTIVRNDGMLKIAAPEEGSITGLAHSPISSTQQAAAPQLLDMPKPGVKLHTSSVRLYPNPVKTDATLLLNSEHAQKLVITVSDASGRVVLHQAEQLSPGANTINIRASRLVKGTYYVQFNLAGKPYNIPLMKLE